MRFQCVSVTCGKPFGWTAKKIVTIEDGTIIEYITCPYCGSLDFEEFNGTIQKKLKTTPPPPVRMPTPATVPDLDASDLMNHRWKGKKKADGTYEDGALKYGWDFKDQFNTATLDVLSKGALTVDQYVFELKGNIVTTKKAK